MIPLRYGLGNVDWQQRINWEDLRKRRVERANQFLAKYCIGAALVYNHDRKRYLTGVWNHPYERAIPGTFCLFVRDNGFPYVPVETHLDADRVTEDCPWLEGKLLNEHELLQPRLTRYRTDSLLKEQYSTCARQVKELLKKHNVADMPVSLDYGSPGLMHALEAEGLTVVDGSPWIDECGMVKFDEEIICMKMAASITEAGYGAVYRDVRVGMKENDVQGIMIKAIYEAGGEYEEGWVVNAGDRTNPRSFNWSDRPLRPREFLSLEACHVNWCGYKVCYDRTFMVGAEPSQLQREIYQTGVEMQARFEELLKPGVTTHELAEKRPRPGTNIKTAEQIKQWRATWSNHMGGMGIAWDSAPYFYEKTEDPEVVLEENMTVAYHALFWAEGEPGGIAIENTYVVTEDGCEALTKWPYEEIMVIGL
jgi:Xaa-Pro aminopeptidase